MSRPRRIPLEDFFRKPEVASVRLSPDGRWLSWMAPYERRLNVFLREIATGQERRLTSATERDVAGYIWVDAGHIVYVQDAAGDENWRLFGVRPEGEEPVDLTPYEGVQCRIVDELEEQDGMILFEMNRRDPQVFDVYRLDVRDGSMHVVAENPGNVQSWHTDHQGRLRLATTTDGVNTSVLYRATEEEEWRPVATYDFKESVTLLGFTFDDERCWVSSNLGRDKAAVCTYDPAAGAELELVYSHPEVDVASILLSKQRKQLTGVAYETDRTHYEFFDGERAALQTLVDEALPGRTNHLVSHTRDEALWVAHSGDDRTLGSYHLVNPGAGTVQHLFDLAPWIVADELCEMRSIQYAARDGRQIPGYLTLPLGVEPKNLPLVVHPHGGPWARDSWGFNPEVQFLANRGMAVLQMNFRGSTGYGRDFLEASFQQWGLAMQDDISDGVQWAIEQGIADPARVAIYGGSYGGYATLAGLTKTPELYRCGVDYVGISSLFTWIESFPEYWKPFLEMVYEMVGHPERDEEQWRATSPLYQLDKIQVPLFVVQGANDPRVKQEESEQLVAALKERGLPVEYLLKEDEGHGFVKEENQFEFYRAMESFLAKHLA